MPKELENNAANDAGSVDNGDKEKGILSSQAESTVGFLMSYGLVTDLTPDQISGLDNLSKPSQNTLTRICIARALATEDVVRGLLSIKGFIGEDDGNVIREGSRLEVEKLIKKLKETYE